MSIRWPASARCGASTCAMRVGGGARPTASHCSGSPAARTAAKARAASPSFSRPSEMMTRLAKADCAWAAKAASSAASMLVEAGLSVSAGPVAGVLVEAAALAVAGRPANSSSCTSPTPAAFAARTAAASAWSASACGTLCDRSSSTSTRGWLRGSSHERPNSDKTSIPSAANCKASATQVRAPRTLTRPAPRRACSKRQAAAPIAPTGTRRCRGETPPGAPAASLDAPARRSPTAAPARPGPAVAA